MKFSNVLYLLLLSIVGVCLHINNVVATDESVAAINALGAKIDALPNYSSAIAALSSKIDALPSQINYSATIATLSAKIDALPKPVDNTSAITALEDKIEKLPDSVENSIASLEAKFVALEALVNSMKSSQATQVLSTSQQSTSQQGVAKQIASDW